MCSILRDLASISESIWLFLKLLPLPRPLFSHLIAASPESSSPSSPLAPSPLVPAQPALCPHLPHVKVPVTSLFMASKYILRMVSSMHSSASVRLVRVMLSRMSTASTSAPSWYIFVITSAMCLGDCGLSSRASSRSPRVASSPVVYSCPMQSPRAARRLLACDAAAAIRSPASDGCRVCSAPTTFSSHVLRNMAKSTVPPMGPRCASAEPTSTLSSTPAVSVLEMKSISLYLKICPARLQLPSAWSTREASEGDSVWSLAE
mmetsp:Transcript_37249/g.92101  ORF Transcript_37249/g.92101 Transcript_37249/m.92101 type:complete len:262 (+) Transcript_37249:1335-2120(+)